MRNGKVGSAVKTLKKRWPERRETPTLPGSTYGQASARQRNATRGTGGGFPAVDSQPVPAIPRPLSHRNGWTKTCGGRCGPPSRWRVWHKCPLNAVRQFSRPGKIWCPRTTMSEFYPCPLASQQIGKAGGLDFKLRRGIGRKSPIRCLAGQAHGLGAGFSITQPLSCLMKVDSTVHIVQQPRGVDTGLV